MYSGILIEHGLCSEKRSDFCISFGKTTAEFGRNEDRSLTFPQLRFTLNAEFKCPASALRFLYKPELHAMRHTGGLNREVHAFGYTSLNPLTVSPPTQQPHTIKHSKAITCLVSSVSKTCFRAVELMQRHAGKPLATRSGMFLPKLQNKHSRYTPNLIQEKRLIYCHYNFPFFPVCSTIHFL